MSWRMTSSPPVPRIASYELPLFTRKIGNWEVYRCFREIFFCRGGLRNRVMWENPSMGEVYMGEERFYEGDARFPSII